MTNKRRWELAAAAVLLVTLVIPASCCARFYECRRNMALFFEAEREPAFAVTGVTTPAQLTEPEPTIIWNGVSVPTACPLWGCKYRAVLTRVGNADGIGPHEFTIECPRCARLMQVPLMRWFGKLTDYRRTYQVSGCDI